MKLLEKNAEDRYQSAFGIKADLQRLKSLTEESSSAEEIDFPLARHDIGPRLIRRDYLYGRDNEVKELSRVFEQVI